MDTLNSLLERVEAIKDLLNAGRIPGAMILVEAELALNELYDSRENLRAENDRLRAERDALVRRMRLLELGVWPDRDCYDQDWGFCVSWENCEYDDALEPIQGMVHDSAESCLDDAADALEAAGILPKEDSNGH